jgi:hypothetical protein
MDNTTVGATEDYLDHSIIKKKLYAKIQIGYDIGDTIAIMTKYAIDYHSHTTDKLFDEIIESIRNRIGCSFEERKTIVKDVILPKLISKNIFPNDSDNASAHVVAGFLCHFTLCNDASCSFCM